MPRPSIYIACGGSGLKTLRALTDLISQDPELRYSFKNRIYYVLIDTEKDELEKTHEHVKDLIPSLDEDHIVKIQTTAGASSLQPLLEFTFDVRRVGESGVERLKEHWWFNEDSGLPFHAPGVSPLDRGAGQCPPVSYFLAWRMLPEIERKLHKLFEEVIEDRSGDRSETGGRNDPMEGINYLIVTGVAGGTGRGCWEIIAMKVRQVCMEKFGAAPKPRAIIFDAAVTSSVIGNNANRIATKVNSLTAYSQLECWNKAVMRKLQTSGPMEGFEYRLPSQECPANMSADVLHLSTSSGQEPPVDQVYLIFGESKQAVLSSPDDYYGMAGRALYAQLKFSEVDSQLINSTYFYNSLGAASIEVAASDLQRHFEAGARIKMLESMCEEDTELVSQAVDKFIADLGLNIDFRRGLLPLGDEKEFSLWQKVIRRLRQQRAGGIASLKEGLAEQGDIEDLSEQLRALLSYSEKEIAEVVDETLAGLGGVLDTARRHLEPLYRRGDLDGVARSVRNLQSFCDQLTTKVENVFDQFPKDLDGILELENPEAIFEAVKGKKFGVFGPRFEEGEVAQIIDAFEQGVLGKNYREIRDCFTDRLQSAIQPLNTIRSNVNVLAERVERLVEKECDILEEQMGVRDLKGCHEKSFTHPHNPISDQVSDSRERFYRRRLKPVLSEEDFESLCKDSGVVRLRDGHKIDSFCFDRLFTSQDLALGKIQMGEEIHREIRQSVSIRPDFIAEKFALESVLEGLQKAWADYIGRVAGSLDEQKHALEVFASIFGFEPKVDSYNEVSVGTIRSMIREICASLASSTAAYWRLDKVTERKVHLFLPPFDCLKSEGVEQLKTEVSKLMPPNSFVEIYLSDKTAAKKANPFVIIALHEESTDLGPDGIKSMQYWREEGVIEQLRLSELPGKKNAIFNPSHGMNGVTFSDPIYINNPVFRKCRWHPWITEDEESAAELNAKKVPQAILYALLSGPPEHRFASIAASKGWHMPLAEMTNDGHLRFTRSTYEWRDGKVSSNPLAQIRGGFEIGKPRGGITEVKSWLESAENRRILEEILAERDAFWQMIDSEGYSRADYREYRQLTDHMVEIIKALQDSGDSRNRESDAEFWAMMIKAARDKDSSLI